MKVPFVIYLLVIFLATARGASKEEEQKAAQAEASRRVGAMALVRELNAVADGDPTAWSRAVGLENVAIKLNHLRGHAELRRAVTAILASPTSPAGSPQRAARFKTTRELVRLLARDLPDDYLYDLKGVYDWAFLANDTAQLDQARELTRLLHPLMVANGFEPNVSFERSTVAKRLLRRQLYLRSAGL